jgi:hypothetical protein
MMIEKNDELISHFRGVPKEIWFVSIVRMWRKQIWSILTLQYYKISTKTECINLIGKGWWVWGLDKRFLLRVSINSIVFLMKYYMGYEHLKLLTQL